MSKSLTSLHLQGPFIQIRSHAQAPGDLDVDIPFSGPLFNSLYHPVASWLWLGPLRWWEAHYIKSWLSSRPNKSNYFKVLIWVELKFYSEGTSTPLGPSSGLKST